jgi:flagellar protein FliO/FliZ
MMRPRPLAKANLLFACTILCCLLNQSSLAQSQALNSKNFPSTMGGAAASGLPSEMWNSNGQNQPTAYQPSERFSPQSQQAAPPQNLRASSPVRVASVNGSNQQEVFGAQEGSQSNVVPASHETSTPSASTSARTLLPPKSKNADSVKPKSGSSTLQMLVSLGSSLAIVIGLFLGVAVLYRKSLTTNLGRGLPKNVVQVLGKTTVAPRQQMLLLRFGSKLVLVSMIQGEARTISEITDPLEVDKCEGNSPESSTRSFREILTQGARV